MDVRLHPHASERLPERGALAEEVIRAVQEGESFLQSLGGPAFIVTLFSANYGVTVATKPNRSKRMLYGKTKDGWSSVSSQSTSEAEA